MPPGPSRIRPAAVDCPRCVIVTNACFPPVEGRRNSSATATQLPTDDGHRSIDQNIIFKITRRYIILPENAASAYYKGVYDCSCSRSVDIIRILIMYFIRVERYDHKARWSGTIFRPAWHNALSQLIELRRLRMILH